MPAKQREKYRPLLKVNLIHIGSRRAYQALPDKLLGEPAHGNPNPNPYPNPNANPNPNP